MKKDSRSVCIHLLPKASLSLTHSLCCLNSKRTHKPTILFFPRVLFTHSHQNVIQTNGSFSRFNHRALFLRGIGDAFDKAKQQEETKALYKQLFFYDLFKTNINGGRRGQGREGKEEEDCFFVFFQVESSKWKQKKWIFLVWFNAAVCLTLTLFLTLFLKSLTSIHRVS